jgi:tRNA dimethylallyltransferase
VVEPPPFIVIIIGPTATGKSILAARLAVAFEGEVVGVDSVQVYKGVDAASGKPTRAVREAVRHHLIDVADPRIDFSAGDFSRLARKAVEDIHRRGKLPVLAGGTGLYLRAVLRGLADMPGRNDKLRKVLSGLEERRGEGSLYFMLEHLDPEWAKGLSSRDTQRIVRALEVALVTGRPLSEWVAKQPFQEDIYPSIKIGLRLPQDVLTARIETKVEEFFDCGLVEEVGRLLEAGIPREANCFKALGYREVLRYLSGEMSLDETKTLVKANTRRYSKRQLTWFRREPGVSWFELGENPEVQYAGVEALVTRARSSRES